MTASDESPITQLLRELKPAIERHEFAQMAAHRYPEYPDVIKQAKAQVNLEEMIIEHKIRTWVEKAGPRKIRNDDDDVPET